jgi:hypothetical protein
MGIRFHCPKGHKLNVKEFQAGRTGICPFCGEKVRIPLESTRPSSKQRKASKAAAVAVAEPPGEAIALELLPSMPEAPETPVVPETPAPTLADPLADGGEVVWYVRPASGGQFGPATPDVMRGWLVEGRVGADSLVWREGWRDWQTAGGVFPQFSPNQPAPAIEAVVPRPAVAAAPQSVAPPLQRRTWTRNTRMVVIASLTTVVVVLSIILLVVVCRQ